MRRKNSFIREPTKPTITEDEDEPVLVKRTSVLFLEPTNDGQFVSTTKLSLHLIMNANSQMDQEIV